MISIEIVTAEWTALSPAEQLRQWSQFISDLDAGEAGFHRFYLVLMPLWDRGDVPAPIADAALSARDDELRAEALWEAAHGFRLDGISDHYGEPPF
jgi:hypothetical protein